LENFPRKTEASKIAPIVVEILFVEQGVCAEQKDWNGKRDRFIYSAQMFRFKKIYVKMSTTKFKLIAL